MQNPDSFFLRARFSIRKRQRLLFGKEQYNSKVFCIGFNKTGTTSFGKAMELMGYAHSSFSGKLWQQYGRGELVNILRYTAKFDSLDDLPWLKEDMIPLLDRFFPNSQFVYIDREEEAWKKSYVRWSRKTFGKEPNLEVKLKEFRAHREFVYDYFNGRPKEEFLILDVKDSMGFKKLANFLGKETDMQAFPHMNQSK